MPYPYSKLDFKIDAMNDYSTSLYPLSQVETELEEELRRRRRNRIRRRASRPIRRKRRPPLILRTKRPSKVKKTRRPVSLAGGRKKFVRKRLLRKRKRPIILTRRPRRPRLILGTSPDYSFSYERAIRMNRHFARILGWRRYQDRIFRLLALPPGAPINRRFVRAARYWQEERGLKRTGVIDPKTWRQMRKRLKISTTTPLTDPEPSFFKDQRGLKDVALSPDDRLSASGKTSERLAAIYNRSGKLMRELAERANVELAAVLAVWSIESNGKKHLRGKTPVKFENHRFYKTWGSKNRSLYLRHFRHGGQAGVTGKRWQNHQFRDKPTKKWAPLAQSTAQSYKAYKLAKQLAGTREAMSALRIGEPQILLSRHASLGYHDAKQMYEAFQNSLRAQLIGFFDFCLHHAAPETGDLLIYLRKRNWQKWARYYNPDRNVVAMEKRLKIAYAKARSLLSKIR